MAKLRMHIDPTIDILDNETTSLGHQLRKFRNETCAQYDTQELPRESNARRRREAKSGSNSKDSAEPHGRRRRTFNMQTYKVHSLGDYVEAIKTYGTTDSYSTEPVSENQVQNVSE